MAVAQAAMWQGSLDMDLRSRALSGVTFCLLIACGAGTGTPGTAEEMAEAMAEFARLDIFSGTALVARDGNILYAGAFGEANKDHHVANTLDTRFNIGSIGKTFTGVAIMQLVERGRIDLHAPVSSYLEDFPFGDAITIHHLLSHTSGMFNYMAHPDYRARMRRLRRISDWMPLIYDQQLVFETPGESFAYSNSGIVTLGAVIERVTGMPYDEYIQANILDPVGMTSTGINYPEDIVPNRATGYVRSVTGKLTSAVLDVPPASADGGIETTVRDLLAFDRALYGESLLNEASKDRMFTPNLENYGYCWSVASHNGHRSIGHGGGAPGVSASFMRYPDDDVTIIVLSNYSGAGSAQQPARALEAVVFGEKPVPPRLTLGETIYRALKDGQADATVENLDELVAQGGYEIRRPFELNNLGYELLGEDEIEMAIAVLELNLSRFPQDANCYDSLAEAHLAAGDRERAITLYRKALEVDPEFENSRRMLERLTTGESIPGT
jgi:CubicO group peptidase (beta-lactamase class C family)